MRIRLLNFTFLCVALVLGFIAVQVVSCQRTPGPADAEQDGGTVRRRGALRLDISSDTEIAGTYELEGVTIAFRATKDAAGGTATASYRSLVGSAAEVSAEVRDRKEGSIQKDGSIRVAGRTMSGRGALGAEDSQALRSLWRSDLGVALALVPMELGCLVDAPATAAMRAALVLPWQMMLKHDPDMPPSRVFDTISSCRYFPLNGVYESPESARGLSLAPNDPIPHIFGWVPLDGEGAVERRVNLEHDISPCRAACRGACGADCEPRNCKSTDHWLCDVDENGQTTGFARKWRRYVCGSHKGCRDHDACYDRCNEKYGCGTWGAFFCMRDCDAQCLVDWDSDLCTGWMFGLGPFDTYLTYWHWLGLTRMDPSCAQGTNPPPDGGAPYPNPPDGMLEAEMRPIGDGGGGGADGGGRDGMPPPDAGTSTEMGVVIGLDP